MGFAAGAIAAATARERYPEVVVSGWTGESQRASTPRSPVQEPECDVWPHQLLQFFYSQILPLRCFSPQVRSKRPRTNSLSCVPNHSFGRVRVYGDAQVPSWFRRAGSSPACSNPRFTFYTRVALLLSFFFSLRHQQK